MNILSAKQTVWAMLLTVLSGALVLASSLALVMPSSFSEDSMMAMADDAVSVYGIGAFNDLDTLPKAAPGDPLPQQAPGWSDTSEFMIGSATASVILMESDGDADTETEDWTATERTNVRNEIQDGLDWWDGRATTHGVDLSFSFDWSNLNNPIDTDYEPINRCGGAACTTGQQLWITEAMDDLGYTSFSGYFDNVRDYNNDQRDSYGTDWAFTIFVVDSSNDANNRFNNDMFAYAYYGGPFMVMTYGNDGWGIGNMNRIAAHETGHIFYAMDEYEASGCTKSDRSGYLNIANANCEVDGTGYANIMLANTVTGSSPRIETRETIGWRDTDGDGIEDILDTFPDTTLYVYSPDPTTDTTPTYTGSATVVPRTNNNPNGPGNDVTINTISNVQFRVDGGAWSGATASDGSFNEDVESFTFTTSSLAGGAHSICARATNSEGNMETAYPCDMLTITDQPPVANAGPNQVTNEGSLVTFNGGGSTDDFGISSYKWDFDASDGVSFSPPDATGVSPTHRYGDNGVYTVTLQVTDTGAQTDTDTMTVTVANVAPTTTAGANKAITEGSSASVSATFTDPGWLDTHTATINWGEGTVTAGTVTEENVKPDSTGTVSGSHTYGDNGAFTVTISVCDDDGACDSDTLTVTVSNLAPSVDALSSPTINEGQTASLNGHATDPGSDDLTFSWSWGYRSTCDSTTTYLNNPSFNPDPTPSPDVNPRDITEAKSCTYGDNGAFTVTLTVMDDDGSSATVTTTVTVVNVLPSIDPLSSITINEARTATLSGHATDPGSDDLTFSWSWGYRSVCDTSATYLNNPSFNPDPLPSPTVNPRDVTETKSCTYGDNEAFTVTLTVTDDDGGTATATTIVTVLNVNPTIDPDIRAYIQANVTLRVAGEKWHDVNLTLYENSTPTASVTVVRMPGSPDKQSATIPSVRIYLVGPTVNAIVQYTPMDDPINGQINGGTPVWIILTLEDGSEVRIHHTFVVVQPSTYPWIIPDFIPYINLTNLPIHFEATASDVGSDDLTFTWNWGDFTLNTVTTYFNDGVAADPFPSPEVNPISEKDEVVHTYTAHGTYTITLTVSDDDSGSVSTTIIVTI